MSKHLRTLALVGNPNAGKSTLFNLLTGLRQKTGNFPGVTVEKKEGLLELSPNVKVRLIDLPGVYSLHPTTSDEKIVTNILTNPSHADYPDAILYVADMTLLDRHMLLLTQVMDLNIPVLGILNMQDIAEQKSIQVREKSLADVLSIPIISTSGRDNHSTETIKINLLKLLNSTTKPSSAFYTLSTLEGQVSKSIDNAQYSPYQALLIAHHHQWLPHISEADKVILDAECKRLSFDSLAWQIRETMQRYDTFLPIVRSAVTTPKSAPSMTNKLDKWILHPVIGTLLFFSIMLLIFQSIFAWATIPMDSIDYLFTQGNSYLKNVLPTVWWASLITDGVLAGLGGIVIFVPQIAFLFFLIAILEEVGYMSRAVFMFDKVMQRFGLNGRSIVALVSGGACAIPAIMSTRTINNWKERLITILVTPFISCSARIPVYALLVGFVVPVGYLGPFNYQGLVFMGLYLLGIVAALLAGWVLKRLLNQHETSYLMIEMPTYQWPQWRNVFTTVWEKVQSFVLEAGKIIFVISIVLWFLASFGPGNSIEKAKDAAIITAVEKQLPQEDTDNMVAAAQLEASYIGLLGKWIEPAIRPLGYDWKIGIALITSFAAREVFVGTMATIYSVGSADEEQSIKQRLQAELRPDGSPRYDRATSLSLLVFYVFAMQCMSTLAVVKRETQSWKWPLAQFIGMTGLAYIAAWIVYLIF